MSPIEQWLLQPLTSTPVIHFAILLNNPGTFLDYLRITFEGSPLVIQIPVKGLIVPPGLSFSQSFLHMGILHPKVFIL